MTISGLLAGLAACIAALVFIGAVTGVARKRSSAERARMAKSRFVGTGTAADRLFGVIELLLAVLFLAGGVASLPVGLAPLLIGLALAVNGYNRIAAKARSHIVHETQLHEQNQMARDVQNQTATSFLNSLSGSPTFTPSPGSVHAVPASRKILNCPHCQRPNDCTGVAGTVACSVCRQTFWVPAVPPPQQIVAPPIVQVPGRAGSDKVAQLQRRAEQNRRQTVVISMVAVTVLFGIIAGAIYWSLPKTPRERDQRWGNILVYVDNCTNQPCEVVIDGEVRESVPARLFRSVRLQSGDRRIGVSQGGALRTDEQRQLSLPSGAAEGKYLLILGQPDTYGEYVAEYQGGGTSFNFAMPRFITSESELRSMYDGLTKKLPTQIEVKAWNNISKYDDVLNKPPREAWLQSDPKNPYAVVNGHRRVLTRLSASDLEFIEKARARTGSGVNDIRDLEGFMKGIMGWN